MLGKFSDNVRKVCPLVHNITNYVTVNDCANIVLACGASPIMADDIGEVCEITSICNALNINIGTLNSRTIPSMLAAGKKSAELGHPIVLDPVGAGASRLRTSTALEILEQVHPTIIRGNISEIKTLCLGFGSTSGVDANAADALTDDSLGDAVQLAKDFARNTGSIVAVTGQIDIVTDGSTAYCIRNGVPMMSSVTGTGCQLSAMTAAFAAANRSELLGAVAAAVCTMGVCGEIAFSRLSEADGSSTFRNYIIDAVYNLKGDELEGRARYEIR